MNPYTLDLGKAKALLEEDGWTLNENGEPFDETRDAVRCKDVDGELMRLSLDFAQVKDNDFAQLVVDQFSERCRRSVSSWLCMRSALTKCSAIITVRTASGCTT